VLINRHPSKNQIDPNQFEKVAKHSISCYLPNNFMLCIEAVNTGQALVHIHEKSDLSKKLIELADLIVKG
jgi:Flp pilus assembly CpaE family ATPase